MLNLKPKPYSTRHLHILEQLEKLNEEYAALAESLRPYFDARQKMFKVAARMHTLKAEYERLERNRISPTKITRKRESTKHAPSEFEQLALMAEEHGLTPAALAQLIKEKG